MTRESAGVGRPAQGPPTADLVPYVPHFSPFDAKNPFLAAVTTNRKLNQGKERHLMHLELDISDSKIRCCPPPRFPPQVLLLG